MVRSGTRETENLAPTAIAERFAITSQLMDMGLALRQGKVLVAPGEARDRLAETEERLEAGPGLRIAPERLEKLKLRE